MTLVIAGNHRQFQYWHHALGRPADWKYVSDTHHLRGCDRNTPVLLVGQWWLSSVDLEYTRQVFYDVTELVEPIVVDDHVRECGVAHQLLRTRISLGYRRKR